MNRKATSILMEQVTYLIILAVFIALISGFLWSRSNSAAVWEDFYAKEIARIVSAGEEGSNYRLDVHHATSIALRNGLDIQEASNLFVFNVQKNEICVKLSKSEGKCHKYHGKNVVSNIRMELGEPTNFLSFSINSRSENE